MRRLIRFIMAVCIVGLLISIIAISYAVRIGQKSLRGLISVMDHGVSIGDMIEVDGENVRIGDAIVIDDGNISIGGSPVDFSEIGEAIENSLSDLGTVVKSGTIGSFVDVSASDFEQKRYAFDAELNRDLTVDVTLCDVIIAGGDVDKIVVDVLECEDYAYRFSTSDNTLIIRDPTKKSGTISIFGFEIPFGSKTPKYTGLAMIIYLPSDFSGKINLNTSGGGVKIGALSTDEALHAVTSSADIELYDVSAYEIHAKTSDGRISLANLAADEIHAVTSGGNISMSELTAKRLSAATSGASIDFTRLFGEKFELTTSGGDISGSILGSQSLFSIVTKTDGNALPPTKENFRAQYSLRAYTNGGDINVRFVD